MIRTRSFPGLAFCIALVAASCGGSDGDAASADAGLVAAFAAYFVDADNDTPVADEAEARCAAEAIVTGIGADRLAEVGVTEAAIPELDDVDLDDREYGIVVDAFATCTDLVGAFTESLAEDLGDEDAQCMAEALGVDVIREALRANLAGDVAAAEATNEAFGVAASFCGLG